MEGENSMKNLQNIKAAVKTILEEEPQTRNSDSLLYLHVLKKVGDDLLTMPVRDFLANMGESEAPPFESVRRTRQKVQAECPWLAACPKVGEYRAENEQAYREFARG